MQRILVDRALASVQYENLVLWYYTPMALPFTDHIDADVCVYDCMDELSAFKNAPRELIQLERLLMQRADVVFTGGQSIYEAKRRLHKSIHPFPSSIDVAHFHKARKPGKDPADQAGIPHPRVGFAGVIDERLDIKLLAQAAEAMPDVHFVMIGPVVKIDPADLPRNANIHWLGGKSYAELPTYMAHWDCGWMPFALNEATRYISPTKTPDSWPPACRSSRRRLLMSFAAMAHRVSCRSSIPMMWWRSSVTRSAIRRICCAARSTPISRPCRGTRPGTACSDTSRSPRA